MAKGRRAARRTGPARRLTGRDYERLLGFRMGLRRFMNWSAHQAEEAGLTPAQYEVLLAVRGTTTPQGPTIGDIASQMSVRHHSAVGLVDRAERAGLVRRVADDQDHRIVRVRLTSDGEERLEHLAALHLRELARVAPSLSSLWSDLGVWEGAPAARRRRAEP